MHQKAFVAFELQPSHQPSKVTICKQKLKDPETEGKDMCRRKIKDPEIKSKNAMSTKVIRLFSFTTAALDFYIFCIFVTT